MFDALVCGVQAELKVKDTQMESLGSEGRDIVAGLDPMLRKCRGHVERLLVSSLAFLHWHLWHSCFSELSCVTDGRDNFAGLKPMLRKCTRAMWSGCWWVPVLYGIVHWHDAPNEGLLPSDRD